MLWRLQAEHGAAAQLLAGGQTLLATLAFRLSDPRILVDITRIAALRGVTVQGERAAHRRADDATPNSGAIRWWRGTPRCWRRPCR